MSTIRTPASVNGGQLYRAVWRWHFYAGLFVIPFLLVLSLSGFVMLVSKPVESWLQQHLTTVTVEQNSQRLPAASLLARVTEEYPNASVQLYIPPRQASESARFSVVPASAAGHAGHGRPSFTVYLNPYTGEILGIHDPARNFYTRVKTLHGSLFLGAWGDSLIETAAGLAVLLIVSGIFLAWTGRGVNTSPRRPTKREFWRSWHKLIGWIIAIPLLLFLLSGLAWTNVWGGKLVQPWGSLPGTRFETPRQGETAHDHAAMNQQGSHQVPWAIEQTPIPQNLTPQNSTAVHPADVDRYDLDAIMDLAKAQGFIHYRVHLPQGDRVAWTVSATTIAGDLTRPVAERTLHIDPAIGQVLADLRFADYPMLGKAMAAFIPLHQGDLGLWNLLLNAVIIVLVIVMIVSGTLLWWKRRAPNSRRLGPPSASVSASRWVLAVMMIIALCFPLSAAALAVMIVLDWLILQRVKALRVAVK